ncbi:hypothetical protein BDF22DRAFT_119189 [Syncephalis plumigaleata]|nr:hypothetical protein BDF22DRAFT_119189 [Syncephalis plumigaleata]
MNSTINIRQNKTGLAFMHAFLLSQVSVTLLRSLSLYKIHINLFRILLVSTCTLTIAALICASFYCFFPTSRAAIMSSLPLSFDQAEPPSSPPPPFEESNPSTTQHVYNSHDILFDFEPPNEPPPSYSAYVHDRVCRLSSLSTFAYRGSGPLQALDNQPQWFYLKSSLFETNLLYLHKPDDSQPAVSITESEGITPVNATSTSDATVTRSLGNLYSSCRATMRQLVDSQIELIKALTFTSDHYVNQLLDKSVSNRNSTRNLMQLFKLRNDNNITSKPDEIQYRASDGARAILKVYLSPLSTFIKLHKSLLSAIQTVYLADTWTSSTFSQLISEVRHTI